MKNVKTVFLIIFVLLVLFMGCKSKGDEREKELEDVETFEFDDTGVPKYDNFLATCKELINSLDEAEASINKANELLSGEVKVGEIEEAIQNIQAMPDKFKDIGEISISLVTQAIELISSAKDDFTGLNARKLPKATSALNSSLDYLKLVPGRVDSIIEAAAKLVTDLSARIG